MARSEAREAIVAAVVEVQQARRAARRLPDHAQVIADGLVERVAGVCNRPEFYEALEELAEAGVVQVGRTIRDTYVRMAE